MLGYRWIKKNLLSKQIYIYKSSKQVAFREMAFVNQPGAGVAYSMVAQSEGMVPQPGYYPQPGMMPQPGYYPQPGTMPMQQVPGVPLPPGAAVQWMQRPSPMPGVPVGLE